MNWTGDHRVLMEQLHHQPTVDIAQGSHRQPEQLASGMANFRKRKSANSTKPKRTVPVTKVRDWKEDETSALLKFVNSPDCRPQRRTRNKKAHWELIVDKIHHELGANSAITEKRCKERMKTLTGGRYYRLVTSSWERMKNEKDNPTDDDLLKLIESCGLTVDWYEAIREYTANQGPCKGHESSGMQMQCDLDRNVPTDRPSNLHIPTVNDPSELVQTPSTQNAGKSVEKKIAKRFNSLNNLRRSTLLELYFSAGFLVERGMFCGDWDPSFLSNVCGWLSIVQIRSCSEIYEDVIALEKLGLVSTYSDGEMSEESDDDRKVIALEKLGLVSTQSGDEMGEESDDEMGEESDDEMGEGSDHEGEVFSTLRIEFSSLRAHEEFFKKVLVRNPAYDTRRRIQDEAMVTFDATCAPSEITVLHIHHCEELEVVDLSGFRKLRSLSIRRCPKLREMIGCKCLEELGWLEMYECPSYHGYPPLQKIPSLQEFRFRPGNHSSTSSDVRPGGELDVSGCVRLRSLEIVGDDALSSIRGLEGLRSLIVLYFWSCIALGNLPDIGHMKDLTHLTLYDTAVEEIKGVEKLSSLKILWCCCSKLKTLPDLRHLPHLQFVDLVDCPVVDDPSSPYYDQWDTMYFNRKIKHVEVSDISDFEHDLSDPEI